jgi:hypothetical protein
MATEYLSEVRNELNSRSQRTTLDELKRKGLEQVRVIRSSQIVQMIERAVDGALARRGQKLGAHERDSVVQDSSKLVKEMMDAQAQLAAMQQEVAARDAALNEAQAKQAELDAELRVMKSRQAGGAPQDLLDELRSLRQEIQARPAAPAAAAAASSPRRSTASAARSAYSRRRTRLRRRSSPTCSRRRSPRSSRTWTRSRRRSARAATSPTRWPG